MIFCELSNQRIEINENNILIKARFLNSHNLSVNILERSRYRFPFGDSFYNDVFLRSRVYPPGSLSLNDARCESQLNSIIEVSKSREEELKSLNILGRSRYYDKESLLSHLHRCAIEQRTGYQLNSHKGETPMFLFEKMLLFQHLQK